MPRDAFRICTANSTPDLEPDGHPAGVPVKQAFQIFTHASVIGRMEDRRSEGHMRVALTAPWIHRVVDDLVDDVRNLVHRRRRNPRSDRRRSIHRRRDDQPHQPPTTDVPQHRPLGALSSTHAPRPGVAHRRNVQGSENHAAAAPMNGTGRIRYIFFHVGGGWVAPRGGRRDNDLSPHVEINQRWHQERSRGGKDRCGSLPPPSPQLPTGGARVLRDTQQRRGRVAQFQRHHKHEALCRWLAFHHRVRDQVSNSLCRSGMHFETRAVPLSARTVADNARIRASGRDAHFRSPCC